MATSPSVKKEKATPKRCPLPVQLPRVEVIVDLDEGGKVCDCCQSALHEMGESSSEALEFVPAHIKVIKTIRPKYTCRHCEQEGIDCVVKSATMPAVPIPRSIATASLLSQIIMRKYQFGLPLYHQETMLGDIGRIKQTNHVELDATLRRAVVSSVSTPKRGVVIASDYPRR